MQIFSAGTGDDADSGGDETFGAAGGAVEELASSVEVGGHRGGAAAVEIEGVVGVHVGEVIDERGEADSGAVFGAAVDEDEHDLGAVAADSDGAAGMAGGPERGAAAAVFAVGDEERAGGNGFGDFVPVEAGGRSGEFPGDFDFGAFGGVAEEGGGAFSGGEDKLVFGDFRSGFVFADFDNFAGKAAAFVFAGGSGETGFREDDFQRFLALGELCFVAGTLGPGREEKHDFVGAEGIAVNAGEGAALFADFDLRFPLEIGECCAPVGVIDHGGASGVGAGEDEAVAHVEAEKGHGAADVEKGDVDGGEGIVVLEELGGGGAEDELSGVGFRVSLAVEGLEGEVGAGEIDGDDFGLERLVVEFAVGGDPADAWANFFFGDAFVGEKAGRVGPFRLREKGKGQEEKERKVFREFHVEKVEDW